MTTEIKVGPLTMIGDILGGHVHVSVLGEGAKGSRPLCGRITVTVDEWIALSESNAAAARLRMDMAELRSLVGVEFGDDKEDIRYRISRLLERDVELQLARPILEAAHEVGEHWRNQDGVNAAYLDKLAEVTKP